MTVALDKKRFGPWALVTGATSGKFAQQIAASGINIVLVERREDLLKEVGVEFSKRYAVPILGSSYPFRVQYSMGDRP
jgi:short-subunit dehydrogenase